MLVYGRKNDTKTMPELTLLGEAPLGVFRVNRAGGPSSAVNCLQQIVKTCTFVAGTIFLQTSDFTYTMEQMIIAVKRMNRADFDILKGRYLLIPEKRRSAFESAFLRVSTLLVNNVMKDVGKVKGL